MEDQLQVLDVDVAVDAPTRTRSTSQCALYQTIAICNKTHVVAIGNGRFVDLYTSSVNPSHPFAFLHQISIRKYINHSPTRQNIGNVVSGENIVKVTSLVFPVPGFLLIAAFVEVPESEISGSDHLIEKHREILLLGFRLYASSVSHFGTFGGGEDTRQAAVSVQVHLSFVEPVVGISGTAIQCLQPCRREMTPDAGAVVLLFDGSESFGVFSWKERFSDRQVSLAQLKQKFSRLVSAECSPDGRYVVIGDVEGRTALLGFQDFPWSGVEESSTVQHKYMYGGKRVGLGVSSRSGVIKRDNPLQNARLIHVAASAGTSCAYSSMRWWIVGVHDQQKQFILAGKRDGSLTVFKLIQENDEASSVIDFKIVQMYPGLASGTHDVVRSITEPMKNAASNSAWFEFYTISEMRWRTWRITIEEVDDELSKRYRMLWPSVKETLEFPAYMIQANTLNGIDMFSVASDFSQILAKTLFDSVPEYEARYPIALVVADNRLQMIGLLTKTPVEGMLKSEGRVSELENDAEKSDHGVAEEEIIDAKTEMSEDKKCSNGPATIQDKYKLPPMEWKTKGSKPVPISQNGERSEPQKIGSGSTAQLSKLSRVDYDNRVDSVMQRVATLSGVMKSMRTSFQLFSSDVQQHMNLVSEQLEEISRRRVTQETAQSSRT